MPTLNQAVRSLERHVGLPEPRSRAVARRLREAGILPAGAPGTAPELDFDNVLDLLIAVAADVPIHRTPAALAALKAMSPGGADLSSAPQHLRLTAGDQLRAIAALAAEGDSDMRKVRLEFVSSWPELAIHWPDGSVQRFRELGELATHWGNGGHCKSITINGAALADALGSLMESTKESNHG